MRLSTYLIAAVTFGFAFGIGHETAVQLIWLIFDWFRESNNMPVG